MTGTKDNGLITLNGSSPNGNVEDNLSFDGNILSVTGSVRINNNLIFDSVNTLPTITSNVSGFTKTLTNQQTPSVIYSLPKLNTNLIHFDYWIENVSSPYNGRGGTVIVSHSSSGNSLGIQDFYTSDLNSPTAFYFDATLNGANIDLNLGLYDIVQNNTYTETYNVILNVRITKKLT